jgi:hypothetical protein
MRPEEIGGEKGVDPGAIESGSPTRRGAARRARSPAVGPSAERARRGERSENRVGLYLRRDLSQRRQRRGARHAAVRHRGDEPPPGRDRHSDRAGRLRCGPRRSGRLASLWPPDCANQHHGRPGRAAAWPTAVFTISLASCPDSEERTGLRFEKERVYGYSRGAKALPGRPLAPAMRIATIALAE